MFLEEMEQVVPWAKLCALIEPHYPKPGNGRRPKELEQRFNLADPAVEEALYDSTTLRQFAGIDLGSEPVPDETTVCKFRHLLEEHNLGEEILGRVNLHLQALKAMEKSIPMARVGRPEEIADAVLWLSSDAASYVTGQSISVDGGFVMR
jgi:hypothetical protein